MSVRRRRPPPRPRRRLGGRVRRGRESPARRPRRPPVHPARSTVVDDRGRRLRRHPGHRAGRAGHLRDHQRRRRSASPRSSWSPTSGSSANGRTWPPVSTAPSPPGWTAARYQVFCPGASTERSPFTVTGEAAAQSADLTALLQPGDRRLRRPTSTTRSPSCWSRCRSWPPRSRPATWRPRRPPTSRPGPFYERIEPVAESFPRPRPGDRPAGRRRRGGHRRGPGSTRSSRRCSRRRPPRASSELADQLVIDVKSLQTEAPKLSAATDAGTAGGYQAVRDRQRCGRAARRGAGVEDHRRGGGATPSIDLLDFEANVEGSLQAFATLKPALDQIDPTLVPQIATAFDALTAVLDTYRDATRLGGWTPYDELTAGRQEDADRRAAGGPGTAVGDLARRSPTSDRMRPNDGARRKRAGTIAAQRSPATREVDRQGTSRRRFLGGAAAAGVGLAAGVGVAAGYGIAFGQRAPNEATGATATRRPTDRGRQGRRRRSVLRRAAGRHHHRPAGAADVRRARRHHHRRRGAAADARPVGGDGGPVHRRASRSATRRCAPSSRRSTPARRWTSARTR